MARSTSDRIEDAVTNRHRHAALPKVYVILLAAIIVSCGSDPKPDIREEYSGQLIFRKFQEQYPIWIVDTDLVVLTLNNDAYSLNHVTHNSNLCSSNGRVLDFGTNRLTLTPTSIQYTGGCDSLHVPRGTFRSTFVRDSLYLGPDTQIVDWADTIQQEPPIIREYTDTLIHYFRLAK
ncbi:MAG TPA: hypothetical protein VN285_08650 [Candidatus Deferrimicrobium sp.]|nr:hypothetical protein [Candidatus Deferrimicrobium sp.]